MLNTCGNARLPGWAVGFLTGLALVIGLAAIARLPIDEHEALVLRTAEEMTARGDWVVPWFNDAPRLNKPPLSYWLTAAVAAAAGDAGTVAAWHGRGVSLLAGLGVLWLTLGLGRALYDRETALTGAGLLVTSAAFFTYTHDARPDLLYTFLCTAAIAAMVSAVRAPPPRCGARMLVMWACLALATLAKGPHVPLMLLAAFVAWLAWRDGLAGVARLRPLAGALLFILIAAPWWVALWLRMPHALAESQLAGSLLQPGAGHLFDGYYLYRPLQLVLPWLPLFPLAWWWALREPGVARTGSGLLGLTLAAAVVGFSLGPQQRYFYLLPLLAPMCLLAGRGCVLLWQGTRGRRVVAGQGALTGAAALGLLAPAGGGVALLALGVALGLALLARGYRAASVAACGGFVTALLVGAVYVTHADSTLLWNAERMHKQRLAAALAPRLSPADRVSALGLEPAVYVFELGRPVAVIERLAALQRPPPGSGRDYVLMRVAAAAALAPGHIAAVVAEMPAGAPQRSGFYLLAPRRKE